MRWGWRRLLIVPLLATVHACDCGGGEDSGCSAGTGASCGPIEVLPCGLLGQCISDGGTCADGLQLDPTMSCNEGMGICCTVPVPSCASLGGMCQASSDLCPRDTLEGDCGDAGVCCGPPLSGDDGSSDAGMPVLDATMTDAGDAPEMTAIGSCNGAPCASGCACVPLSPDAGSAPPDGATPTDGATLPSDGATVSAGAGGGICVCPIVDASADAASFEDADAADAEADGESNDAAMSDAAAAGDAMTAADGSDAGGSCGVILCAAGCTCMSVATSACTCP
jgi:hypothetical protein